MYVKKQLSVEETKVFSTSSSTGDLHTERLPEKLVFIHKQQHEGQSPQ